MTLFDELKASTKPAHDKLEKELDLLSPEIQLSDYRKILEKFWGVYVPLEKAVRDSEIGDAFHGRWKTELLRQDLVSLGLSEKQIQNLPVAGDFSGPFSTEELLGSLYVMEGSSLGAMILSKHFHLRFHLDSLNGLAFFSGYGENTPLKWREWRSYSESLTHQKSLSHEAVLFQANKTFTDLGKWMRG